MKQAEGVKAGSERICQTETKEEKKQTGIRKDSNKPDSVTLYTVKEVNRINKFTKG